MSEAAPRILFVCTGNICRSPAAEYLFRARAGDALHADSAGTGALVGHPVAEPMRLLLDDLGIQTAGFRSQQLAADRVRSADLVLTMTRSHRGDVAELWPKAVRYSFTLKEFARLIGDVPANDPASMSPAERLFRLVDWARTHRHHVADSRLDEVADPYRRDPSIYEQALREIAEAIDTMTEALRPDQTSQRAG